MEKLAYGIKTDKSTLTQAATEMMLVGKATLQTPPGPWQKEMDKRRTHERRRVTHHRVGTARPNLLLLKWRIISSKLLLLTY